MNDTPENFIMKFNELSLENRRCIAAAVEALFYAQKAEENGSRKEIRVSESLNLLYGKDEG